MNSTLAEVAKITQRFLNHMGLSSETGEKPKPNRLFTMPRGKTSIPNPDFFDQPTQSVAQQLLGCRLISRVGNRLTGGIIVETEAYLPVDDPACHGTRGKTRSNAAMFGPAGRAYVYPIHAGHCFNVVTQSTNEPTAVLIRSLIPVWGIEHMIQRRSNEDLRKLTTGPSRLCQALGINRKLDHHDLTLGQRVWIENGAPSDWDDAQQPIGCTPRIGVTSAKDLKLRFIVQNNRFVSGSRKLRIGDAVASDIN